MIKFIYDNKENSSLKIAKEIKDVILKKSDVILCLPTGNSPIIIYKNLVDFFLKKEINFEKVTTYNLDEYLDINVDKSPISFKNFMCQHLFSKVNITNYNFPKTIEQYNEKLDLVEKFDFTLLGVGTNGHIAFNEPGSSETNRTSIVELHQETIKANFDNYANHPTRAITMGIKDIYEKSKKIVIMAWGESKKNALLMLKKGEKNNQWPITFFCDHPNILVYTDIDDFKN